MLPFRVGVLRLAKGNKRQLSGDGACDLTDQLRAFRRLS
jgi:hypothetical protein